MSAVLVEDGPDKGAIWHFGEPNQEQKALVAGNGWADLSHRGVISITGKDRLTWERPRPCYWISIGVVIEIDTII